MKKIFPAVLFSLCVLFGLVLQAAETAQTIEVGRVLDKESVSGQTPDVSSGAFTVAMRFRPLGQGVEEFSGQGMLFSVASGYYEGFRAHYGNAAQDVIFEIGIPEVRHSVSARTQATAPLGVLSDLVCTYDGAVMKIYLNGEEAASQATTVKIETKNAPLRVGYVNYGIGSTKMFVENVEFADRALTLEEVQARFAKHPAEEVRKIAMMKKFKIAGNAVNLDLDQEALDFFVGLEDLTESSRTAALDARWQLLMARREFKEAEPLLLAKAETLKKPVPEDETLPQQNVRMSALFDVLEALDALA
nr:LamG domain-containing protein [Thermoguttaceae bacterium]